MIRLSVILSYFFHFLYSPIVAQNYCVKTAPLNYVWGSIPFTNEFNAGIEKHVLKNASVSGHLAFIYPYDSYEGRYKITTSGGSGGRAQFMYRYYFAPRGCLAGFYGAFHVSCAYLQVKYPGKPEMAAVQKSTADLLIGYQFITTRKWAFDFFTGSGIRSKQLDVPAGYAYPSQATFGNLHALRLAGGINIGYAF